MPAPDTWSEVSRLVDMHNTADRAVAVFVAQWRTTRCIKPIRGVDGQKPTRCCSPTWTRRLSHNPSERWIA